MAQSDDLKSLVATMLMLPCNSVGSSTSLASLDTSLGGARLTLGVKRLGYVPQFRRVPSTFGELEQSLYADRDAVVVNAGSPAVDRDPIKPLPSSDLDIGLDIQDISALPICADYWNHEFYRGCFSRLEIAYAVVQTEPRSHFAGFWSAKEALKKCDPGFLKADLSLLSIYHEAVGKPYFFSHHPDKTFRLPHSISISHSGNIASAVVALRRR